MSNECSCSNNSAIPYFNMMPFWGNNYYDASWITDSRTSWPDWIGPASIFSGLNYNNYNNFCNPFLFMNIFNASCNAAMSQCMQNMQYNSMLSSMFSSPQISPSAKDSSLTSPQPEETLTDEQKAEFNKLKIEFDNLYNDINGIKDEYKTALDLDKVLAKAKKAYEDSGNNTVDSITDCIKILNDGIDNLKPRALKKILNQPQLNTDDPNQTDIDKIYNTKDASKLKNLIVDFTGEENIQLLSKGNIIEQIDNRISIGESNILDYLLSLGSSKDIMPCAVYIVNALIKRATNISENLSSAVINNLKTARDNYRNKQSEDNKAALSKAFIELYKEIKLAEARQKDELNIGIITELPQKLQEKYLDNDGNLKNEFKLYENAAQSLINQISADNNNNKEESSSGASAAVNGNAHSASGTTDFSTTGQQLNFGRFGLHAL